MTVNQERYEKHLNLAIIGQEGQEKLYRSRVLLVGAGGLGSPIAMYLAAAGVGTIGIIDGDKVALSNLQRQVIHSTSDVNRLKVDSAQDRMRALNPEIGVIALPEFLTTDRVTSIFGMGWDLVIDACDNSYTRYLLNDACLAYNKPLVSGALHSMGGQVTTFKRGDGPCYRCLYPDNYPGKDRAVSSQKPYGVLSTVPGVIGTLQATEALKVLLGLGTSLVGTILIFNATTMTFQSMILKRDIKCPSCSVYY